MYMDEQTLIKGRPNQKKEKNMKWSDEMYRLWSC